MPLENCPACRILLTPKESGGGECPKCGARLPRRPEPQPEHRDFHMNPGIDTRRIATAQKLIIWAALFHVIAIVTPFAIRAFWPQLGSTLWISLLVVSDAVNIVAFSRLARALRRSLVLTVVALLLPGIALITLLSMNAEATALLQAAGVRVGLLGAKSSDLKSFD